MPLGVGVGKADRGGQLRFEDIGARKNVLLLLLLFAEGGGGDFGGRVEAVHQQ